MTGVQRNYPMHDVGKIGIPDNILMKPGKLTNEDFDFIENAYHYRSNNISKFKSRNPATGPANCGFTSWKMEWQGVSPKAFWRKNPHCRKNYWPGRCFWRPHLQTSIQRSVSDWSSCWHNTERARREHFDPDVADIFLENIDAFIKIKEEVGSAEDVSLGDFTWSERDQDAKRAVVDSWVSLFFDGESGLAYNWLEANSLNLSNSSSSSW